MTPKAELVFSTAEFHYLFHFTLTSRSEQHRYCIRLRYLREKKNSLRDRLKEYHTPLFLIMDTCIKTMPPVPKDIPISRMLFSTTVAKHLWEDMLAHR